MIEDYCILPCSPDILCEDRFSITESEELHVPFWEVLTTLLNTTAVDSHADLIDILETVAVTRRGRSDTDYGFLKRVLISLERKQYFFDRVWPVIKDLALEMPTLFPGSQIPILGRQQWSLVFSRRQVACLVVHQFLCTLTAPTWQDGFQDFHIWYSSEQPHTKAVEAYLTALVEYFFRLVDGEEFSPLVSGVEDWPISYTLHTTQDPLFADDSSTPLTDLRVMITPEASTSPSLLGLPDGAAVISANKFIGFGRTGTQEETHVGASPECCPAVLITPPLEANQALVVTGPEAMVTVSGYQRSARCGKILRPEATDTPQEHRAKWRHRTMLFMDAMELDLDGRDAGLPDLKSGNVDRELRKAYTAFSSYKQSDRSAYSMIYTGYWGCGTFGGNPGVKSLIQWCAASLAGCDSTFICSGEERRLFGEQLEKFVGEVKDKTTASDLVKVLRRLRPVHVKPGDSVFGMIKSRIHQ